MREIVYNHSKINLDSGVYFGRGVFETVLVKENAIFLKQHINRLNCSIKKLSLGEGISLKEMEEFIQSHKITNKALKIVVTETNIIFVVRDIKYNKRHYINGFKVKISNVIRNSTSKLTYIKSLNYLENILEYEDAQREGYNEVIFFNERNELCEGSTTNIFIVKDNKIYTPKLECGLLPGIIREWVKENFNVMEKVIIKDDLINADEIFLTNSLVGIIKISEIEGKRYNSKISNNILRLYEMYLSTGGNYYG